MNMQRYRDIAMAPVLDAPALVESNMHGLTAAEAAKRLLHYGQNFVEYQRLPWWKLLLRQVHSFFTYLLLIAAGINIALGSYTDAFVIVGFVLIFVTAGFLQESKAEATIFSLRTFLPQYAKVRRDHAVSTIDSKDLVPGDVLFVHEGDLIPADVRLLHTKNLLVDESSLTGESAPVTKNGMPTTAQGVEPASDLESPTLGFFGSTVVGGFAQAVVIATGHQTYFSHLFEKLNDIERPSLFELNIRKIGKFLSNLIVFLALIAFAVRIIITGDVDVSFLVFLIALVIAAVPEALPLVVTLTLSKGTLALARKDVVVKRLTSLEDLGNIDVLCTDKTGTITENRLTIAGTYPDRTIGAGSEYQTEGDTIEEVLKLAFVSSLSSKKIGKLYNPFDIAIFNRSKVSALREVAESEFLEFLPFDPVRKVNSVVYRNDGEIQLVSRGAPEAILSASSSYRSVDGASRPLDDAERERALAWFRDRGFRGDRVLALGIKQVDLGAVIAVEEREGLEFVGMLAFNDPLKETSKAALGLIRDLAVDLIIITGDAPEVAGAVGYQLGLIPSPEAVMTGAEFEALALALQRAAVLEHHVFARTSPIHKERIIEALRLAGKSVAFIGDGFNDVPALKVADVAITVHGASDMAKSVSDIVLLKEDLMVIAQGVSEGRKIFANVVKYIRTTLAANVGNFFSLTLLSFFIRFLPMLPIQLLLVNLLSDLPMVSIAVDRVTPRETARPQQYDLKRLFVFVIIFGIVNSLFDFAFFSMFIHADESAIRTGWFILSIFTEIAAFVSLRTLLPFWRGGWPAPGIIWFSLLACAISILLPIFAVTRNIFSFTFPTGYELAVIAGLVAAYFVVNEVAKAGYARMVKA